MGFFSDNCDSMNYPLLNMFYIKNKIIMDLQFKIAPPPPPYIFPIESQYKMWLITCDCDQTPGHGPTSCHREIG